MIHELLRRQPLFKGLSDSQIATLAGTVEVVDVPEGTLLFAAGGPAAPLYLVVSGRVSLELAPGDHSPLVVQTVGPGELLGLSWLAEKAHWQWDARAAVDTCLVEFSVVGLRRLWASDHELERILMERIAATLAERLHAARLQLADLYGDNW